MNPITVPYICYGRYTSQTMAGRDQYGVVSTSSNFPDEARQVLERQIIKAFQWTNGTVEVYPDSFLLWQLDEKRYLFSRLCDGGKDSLGRPHAVSTISVLLNISDFENVPEALASIAYSSAWQEPTAESVTLTPQNTDDVVQLAEKLKTTLQKSPTAILIERHPFVQCSSEIVTIKDFHESDFVKHEVKQTQPDAKPNPSPAEKPSGSTTTFQPQPLVIPPPKESIVKFVVLLVLVVCSLLCNVYFGFQWVKTSQQVNQSKQQIEDLKGNLSTLNNEYTTAKKNWETDKASLREELKNDTRNYCTGMTSEQNKQFEQFRTSTETDLKDKAGNIFILSSNIKDLNTKINNLNTEIEKLKSKSIIKLPGFSNHGTENPTGENPATPPSSQPNEEAQKHQEEVNDLFR